ncbi:MAG: hypothetical protein AB7P76_09485 [Candidatus Melainabacteria bacterium]
MKTSFSSIPHFSFGMTRKRAARAGALLMLSSCALPCDTARAVPPVCPSAEIMQTQSRQSALPAAGARSATITGIPAGWCASAQRFYDDATRLQTQHPSNPPDSVDLLKLMSRDAARISGNDPDHFLRLMNEVLIADARNALRVPARRLGGHRLLLGDTGFHPLYRDGSAGQSYHLWVYVNYGFYNSLMWARTANVTHEIVEPALRQLLHRVHADKGPLSRLSQDPSEEDYRLSYVGYALGHALRKGSLTPETFADSLDEMLRTGEANAINPDAFINRLMPAAQAE